MSTNTTITITNIEQALTRYMVRVVYWILLLTLLTALATGATFWFLPVDYGTHRAAGLAPPDGLSQFEAIEHATAVWWFWRVASLVVISLTAVALARIRNVGSFLAAASGEFLRVTGSEVAPAAQGQPRFAILRSKNAGTWALRSLVLTWLLCAAFHAIQGVRQRLNDWPVYQLKTGVDVLPNMSESNRDVIRYLLWSTPENSRIFVVSDQKLFFLSYYLLPRRVYHSVHPDSEFVMPLPENRRQLAAKRLSDLPLDYLRRLRPDYILEYFEGSEYIDRQKLYDDTTWISFQKYRRGASYQPEQYVALRRVGSVVPP